MARLISALGALALTACGGSWTTLALDDLADLQVEPPVVDAGRWTEVCITVEGGHDMTVAELRGGATIEGLAVGDALTADAPTCFQVTADERATAEIVTTVDGVEYQSSYVADWAPAFRSVAVGVADPELPIGWLGDGTPSRYHDEVHQVFAVLPPDRECSPVMQVEGETADGQAVWSAEVQTSLPNWRMLGSTATFGLMCGEDWDQISLWTYTLHELRAR